MYAVYSPAKGYFKGYLFQDNKMTPQWGSYLHNFTLAIFINAQDALDEAAKHGATAYHINQLPTP